MAKLGSPELVGQWALAWAVCTPVVLFSRLHLRTVLSTDAQNRFAFGDYLGLTILTATAATIGIAIFAMLAFSDVATIVTISLVAALCFLESGGELLHGLLQKHERMDRIGISLLLRGGLSLALLVLMLALTQSLSWAIAGMIVATAVVLIGYDAPQSARALGAWRELSPRWNPAVIARLAWLALPLGLVMLVIGWNENVPRYFLEHYRGRTELGIFAAAASLMSVSSIPMIALCQAAAPRLARHYLNVELRQFRREIVQLVLVAILLGAAGIAVALFWGSLVLRTAFTPEFAAHEGTLTLLMIAAAIQCIGAVAGTVIMSMHRFSIPLPVHIVTAIVILSVGSFLVGNYGLPGAAALTIVSGIFPTLVFGYIIFRTTR